MATFLLKAFAFVFPATRTLLYKQQFLLLFQLLVYESLLPLPIIMHLRRLLRFLRLLRIRSSFAFSFRTYSTVRAHGGVMSGYAMGEDFSVSKFCTHER